MNIIQKTAIAATLLFGACQSGPTEAAPESPAQPSLQQDAHDHAQAGSDHAAEGAVEEAESQPHTGHIHIEGVENVLAAGEYDEGDVVAQPVAGLGDITICPVSGEAFTVTEDSPFFEHEGATYYFCCPTCVRPFQRDPAGHLGGGSEMQVVTAEGVSFDPAVEKSQIPSGSWICDMGTVHYARAEEGDGTCPRCNMRLHEHTN